MARDDDRCLNDDIQRVRERMVDDHNELKGEHQSILSAIRTGFREMSTRLDAVGSSDGFSKFDLYLRVAMILGIAAAILVGFARGGA